MARGRHVLLEDMPKSYGKSAKDDELSAGRNVREACFGQQSSRLALQG